MRTCRHEIETIRRPYHLHHHHQHPPLSPPSQPQQVLVGILVGWAYHVDGSYLNVFSHVRYTIIHVTYVANCMLWCM